MKIRNCREITYADCVSCFPAVPDGSHSVFFNRWSGKKLDFMHFPAFFLFYFFDLSSIIEHNYKTVHDLFA